MIIVTKHQWQELSKKSNLTFWKNECYSIAIYREKTWEHFEMKRKHTTKVLWSDLNWTCFFKVFHCKRALKVTKILYFQYSTFPLYLIISALKLATHCDGRRLFIGSSLILTLNFDRNHRILRNSSKNFDEKLKS